MPLHPSKWVLAPVFIALALCIAITWAHGHSFYPYQCCSEMDCYPVSVPRDEIERREDGWFLKKERVTIPFSSARTSPDHQFHICRNDLGNGTLITPKGEPPCLWAPGSEG